MVGDPMDDVFDRGGCHDATDGMAHNLKDELEPPQFGARPGVSLDSRFGFQGAKLSVCQNGS
jgi:hypothetical protein